MNLKNILMTVAMTLSFSVFAGTDTWTVHTGPNGKCVSENCVYIQKGNYKIGFGNKEDAEKAAEKQNKADAKAAKKAAKGNGVHGDDGDVRTN
jgi:hypothetical protein